MPAKKDKKPLMAEATDEDDSPPYDEDEAAPDEEDEDRSDLLPPDEEAPADGLIDKLAEPEAPTQPGEVIAPAEDEETEVLLVPPLPEEFEQGPEDGVQGMYMGDFVSMATPFHSHDLVDGMLYCPDCIAHLQK